MKSTYEYKTLRINRNLHLTFIFCSIRIYPQISILPESYHTWISFSVINQSYPTFLIYLSTWIILPGWLTCIHWSMQSRWKRWRQGRVRRTSLSEKVQKQIWQLLESESLSTCVVGADCEFEWKWHVGKAFISSCSRPCGLASPIVSPSSNRL